MGNERGVSIPAYQSTSIALTFSLTTGQVAVLDLQTFINNQNIQVNVNGGLTAKISFDGINYYTGPTLSSTGITPLTTKCRYIQLTATGTCSGLAIGSLF